MSVFFFAVRTKKKRSVAIMSSSLETLSQIHVVQKENSKKMSSIKQQFDSAKQAVMDEMEMKNIPFQAIGNNEFVVLKTKAHKPPLNDDILSCAYKLHCRNNLAKEANDVECSVFLGVVKSVQDRLSEVKKELVFQRSQPVQSLLME